MASLGMSFDANTVDPSSSVVLPAGDYPVQIVNSEMRPTTDGTGQYLWLEQDIVDGAQRGLKVYDRLNLFNKNEKAVEIANKTLSQICHATGVMHVTDSEQLHFKPMIARVEVRPPRVDERTGKSYGASNEVKGYAPLTNVGSTPSAAAMGMPAGIPVGQPQNNHFPQAQAGGNGAGTPPAGGATAAAAPWKR